MMNRSDYELICQLVYKETSIVLGPDKEYLVRTRLDQLARDHGYDGIEKLITKLRGNPMPALVRGVADIMTTNETSFFRDGKPYEVLRAHLFPELIRSRRSVRRLRIWSAACSTGQEPYSIAMTLMEYFPEVKGWDVKIVASDYSQRVLKQAKQGEYTSFDVRRGMEPEMLNRYFEKGPDRTWRVRPILKKWIEFRQCNLTGMWPVISHQDLVMLRNVLIYFDEATRRKILERIPRTLGSDGYLMLGTAESPFSASELFDRKVFGNVSCFQAAKSARGAVA